MISRPRKLGAEQKEIDAASNNAQISVVQDHSAKGEIGQRSGIVDCKICCIARELRRRGRAKKTRHRAGPRRL